MKEKQHFIMVSSSISFYMVLIIKRIILIACEKGVSYVYELINAKALLNTKDINGDTAVDFGIHKMLKTYKYFNIFI
jgi:hypothetical protein